MYITGPLPIAGAGTHLSKYYVAYTRSFCHFLVFTLSLARPLPPNLFLSLPHTPALGTDSTAVSGRSGRLRVRMGTEFEDENAKEKLKAMLNRQFGIGDVSFLLFAATVRTVHERTFFRVSPPPDGRRAVVLYLGARVAGVVACKLYFRCHLGGF